MCRKSDGRYHPARHDIVARFASARHGKAILKSIGGLEEYEVIGVSVGMANYHELKRAVSLAISLAGNAVGLAVPTAHAASDLKPVPYWASLKANEVYMRVGPGADYRINWIYHRQHLPVKVLRIMQNWRLVEDPQGVVGWIMVNMLVVGHDGFVVGRDTAKMRETANDTARLLWRLEPGVLGKLGDCNAGWCRFTVNARVGYVRQGALWGATDLVPTP